MHLQACSRVALLSISAALPALGTEACAARKSDTPPAAAIATAQHDAGAANPSNAARSSEPRATSSGPSAPLPKVNAQPAFTIVSSKRTERLPRAGTTACTTSARAARESPQRDVETLAKSCAAATAMKLMGSVLSGSQSATKPALEFPLEAQADRCYRVAFAAAPSVRSISVIVRDSEGAVSAEEISNASLGTAPRDGVVCFKAKERAAIVASVGDGDGAFALYVLEGNRL
jgi:hypothetical protein